MKYPQNFSISLQTPADTQQRRVLIFLDTAGSGVPLLPGERCERCEGVGMLLRGSNERLLNKIHILSVFHY